MTKEWPENKDRKNKEKRTLPVCLGFKKSKFCCHAWSVVQCRGMSRCLRLSSAVGPLSLASVSLSLCSPLRRLSRARFIHSLNAPFPRSPLVPSVYTSLASASFPSLSGRESHISMMSILNNVNTNPAAVDASAPELLLDQHVKYIQALDTVIPSLLMETAHSHFRYQSTLLLPVLECVVSLTSVLSIRLAEEE